MFSMSLHRFAISPAALRMLVSKKSTTRLLCAARLVIMQWTAQRAVLAPSGRASVALRSINGSLAHRVMEVVMALWWKIPRCSARLCAVATRCVASQSGLRVAYFTVRKCTREFTRRSISTRLMFNFGSCSSKGESIFLSPSLLPLPFLTNMPRQASDARARRTHLVAASHCRLHSKRR